MSLAPVAPSGWPNAQAPPFTLSLLRSAPSSFSHASGTTAKASFTSYRSMSAMAKPARASAACVAGIGPDSMSTGSVPASASVWISAIGVTEEPSLASPASFTIMSAAAPSEIWLALPAVTAPSGRSGCGGAAPILTSVSSFASFSTVVPGRMPSSLVTVTAVLAPSSSTRKPSTGSISSAKRPLSVAAKALACDAAASVSISSREMSYLTPIISADTNCE
mmetsp:Transcript_170384/g.414170  ORF Transcript_170384/g.414170 Transcript_170384/m.414170 type:complete len:221 (-) Transcript_170384:110-772(-)